MVFPLRSVLRTRCRSCLSSKQQSNLISIAEKHRRCELVRFGEQPLPATRGSGRIPREDFATRELYAVVRDLVTRAILRCDLVTD
jgi:hypothetical protein